MNFKATLSNDQGDSHDGASMIYASPLSIHKTMLLTRRELEVLRYMAMGSTSEQIAVTLFISKQTIDSHRKNIIKKLGVSNVTAAVAFALRRQIIQ